MRRRLDASTVVVIVGASSGIGRAAALRFARHGCRLVLAARSRSSLTEVADQCVGFGAEAGIVVADITRPGEVERIADEAQRRFGRIDVWVAAASVFGYGEIDRMPAAEARAIIDTNLHGTIDQVRAALPALRGSGGVVVIVGSVFSALASPYVWAYAASKHAVAGFAASVRQELRRGPHPVDVAMIWPATTDTPIYQHAANRTGRSIHPIPPAVEPDRVARAIVRASVRPRRRRVVGMVQGSFLALHAVAPGVADRVLAVTMSRLGLRRPPMPPTSGTVEAPDPRSNAITGGWRQR
jgi:short-subunit dehydrogenase